MINYITAPFRWFFKLEAASGLVLLIAAIIALILSNTNFSDLYFGILNTKILLGTENFGLDLSILHWINDALMAIFFFVVTLEIKREFIHGELSKPKQALLPIIGKRACLGLESSPWINSLLISRVTIKKNTAINASLIQCKILRSKPKFFVPINK